MKSVFQSLIGVSLLIGSGLVLAESKKPAYQPGYSQFETIKTFKSVNRDKPNPRLARTIAEALQKTAESHLYALENLETAFNSKTEEDVNFNFTKVLANYLKDRVFSKVTEFTKHIPAAGDLLALAKNCLEELESNRNAPKSISQRQFIIRTRASLATLLHNMDVEDFVVQVLKSKQTPEFREVLIATADDLQKVKADSEPVAAYANLVAMWINNTKVNGLPAYMVLEVDKDFKPVAGIIRAPGGKKLAAGFRDVSAKLDLFQLHCLKRVQVFGDHRVAPGGSVRIDLDNLDEAERSYSKSRDLQSQYSSYRKTGKLPLFDSPNMAGDED